MQHATIHLRFSPVPAAFVTAIGLAFLGLVGCVPAEETPADGGNIRGHCEHHLECPVGQACVDKRCRQLPCDGRCSAEEVCMLTECVAAEGLDCVADRGICPGGFLCGPAGTCQRLCVTDDDCPNAENSSCNPEAGGAGIAACSQCTFPSDCPEERPHCTAAGRCVECGDDSQCEENGQVVGKVCDPATSSCIAGCKSERDCKLGERCEGATDDAFGLCVECSENTETIDCAPRAPRVRCEPGTRHCVECLENRDCAGRGQCDVLTKTCVECTSNDGCDPGNICDQSTLTCVPGCVGGKGDRNCPTDTVCDASQGDRGVCVDCLSDGDCPRAHICEAKSCYPGCRTSEAQCAAPAPSEGEPVAIDVYCDPTRAAFGECVECLTDDHCGADQVCDADAKRCRCKREGESCSAMQQCGFREFRAADGTLDCSRLRPYCVSKVVCPAGEKSVAPVCTVGSTALPGSTTSCPPGFITENAKDLTGTSGRQCVPNSSAYRCN